MASADAVTKAIEQRSRIEGIIARKEARITKELLTNPAFQTPKGAAIARTAMAAMARPCLSGSARPVSPGGSVSFNFGVSYVHAAGAFSKAAGTTALGAAATQAYIEREGAAEDRSAVADRDARAAMRAEMMMAMEDPGQGPAAATQAYIERDDAPEAIGRVLSSFGTIPGDTPEERMACWDALAAYEQPPKNHTVLIDPQADPAFWAAVDADPDAPRMLRERDKIKPTSAQHPDAEVASMYRYARSRAAVPPTRPLSDPSAPKSGKTRHPGQAVAIEEGRATRIQTKIIGELPHELDAQQRLILMKHFCEVMFNQPDPNRKKRHRTKGRAGPVGDDPKYATPFWCVIHAPDEHNDPRNFHFHIAFSERPFERMLDPSDGQWKLDFQVDVTTKTKQRKTETRQPHAKNRDADFADIQWIRKARTNFALCANMALAEAGTAKRYDPRTYKDMGMGVEARERLPKTVIGQEKRGIPHPKADAAAAAQCERLVAAAVKADPKEPYSRAKDHEWAEQVKRWSPQASAHTLQAARLEWRATKGREREARAEAAAGQIVYDKIASRLDAPLAPADEWVKGTLKSLRDSYVANWRRRATDEASYAAAIESKLKRAKELDPNNHEGTSANPGIHKEPSKFGKIPGFGKRPELGKAKGVGGFHSKQSPEWQAQHEAFVKRTLTVFRAKIDAAAPLDPDQQEVMDAHYVAQFGAAGIRPKPAAPAAPAEAGTTRPGAEDTAPEPRPSPAPKDAAEPKRNDGPEPATGNPASSPIRGGRTEEEIDASVAARAAAMRPEPLREPIPNVLTKEERYKLNESIRTGLPPKRVKMASRSEASHFATKGNENVRRAESAPEAPRPESRVALQAKIAPAESSLTTSTVPVAPPIAAQRRPEGGAATRVAAETAQSRTALPVAQATHELIDRQSTHDIRRALAARTKAAEERAAQEEAKRLAEAAEQGDEPPEDPRDPKKRRKTFSQEENRRRALLAARNRGVGR